MGNSARKSGITWVGVTNSDLVSCEDGVDTSCDGKVFWADGTIVNTGSWSSAPTLNMNGETCVAFSANIFDYTCSEKYNALCQLDCGNINPGKTS